MSEQKLERNKEIVYLINQGISYRNIAKVVGITCARIMTINKVYNKEKQGYCVMCLAGGDLLLENKVRNICKICANRIKSY